MNTRAVASIVHVRCRWECAAPSTFFGSAEESMVESAGTSFLQGRVQRSLEKIEQFIESAS